MRNKPSSDEAPLVGVPCAKVGFAEQKSEGETSKAKTTHNGDAGNFNLF